MRADEQRIESSNEVRAGEKGIEKGKYEQRSTHKEAFQ